MLERADEPTSRREGRLQGQALEAPQGRKGREALAAYVEKPVAEPAAEPAPDLVPELHA